MSVKTRVNFITLYFRSMALERVKVIKGNNEPLDEMEKQVSQALLDLEVNSDLKASLRELHVTAVKEVRKYCFNKYVYLQFF